ncbi:MAG: hypothetical protein KA767_06470 [Saprospiraceae bacterium]|nr:hypothetical protein [Saprospiraceae bacterium]
MTRFLIMLFLFTVNFSFGQLLLRPYYSNSSQRIYEICDSIGAVDYFFTPTPPFLLKEGFEWLCHVPMDVVMENLTAGLAVQQTKLFMKEIIHVKSNEQLIKLLKQYPHGHGFLDKETSEYEIENFLCQIEESKIRIYYAGNPPKSFWIVKNQKLLLDRIPKRAIPIAEKDFKYPID